MMNRIKELTNPQAASNGAAQQLPADTMEDTTRSPRDKAVAALDRVKNFAADHSMVSLGAALAAGLAVGIWLKRK